LWDMLKRTQYGLSPFTVVALVVFTLILKVQASDTDVVINEIMYHPPFDMEELQFIEIYNRGSTEVDVSKWSFTKGIQFVFPDQTRLPASGYLVVCRNAKVFSSNYGGGIPAVGNFSGRLSHGGEKVELADAKGNPIDSVKYADHEPWPAAPDGHSASLERINPFESGKDPGNWAGSKLQQTQALGGTPGRKNDSFSTNLPPVISHVDFKAPGPRQKTVVTAEIADPKGVKSARLLWRIARTGGETSETAVPMDRTSGDDKHGTYQASIEGQPADTLVRFRIEASNNAGAARMQPSPNEPQPSYSFAAVANTNKANIAFAYVIDVSEPRRDTRVKMWNRKDYFVPAAPTRGNGAFIYVPPQGGAPITFDHVRIRPRKGGFKVHFNKGEPFKGMTGINVIFESSPRWLLSEPMAYELYRLAGNPALLQEHVRVFRDGQAQGYHLLIEQVNKGFLTRNHRNDTGYLYKATWTGQGLIGQHNKRTRPATGYEDLMWLHERLVNSTGAEQWDFIQKNFNVEVFATYYAVNMCIQNWDGFFNNYWLYHDSGGTGKWEIYPWDEDKTWGDYDGASPNYDWYTMPLTFGMNDSRGARPDGGFGWGAGGWWRPPGWFSGPLLANPQFRKVFLTRLKDICTTVFTEEKMVPLIDAMEKRLEPEMAVTAHLSGSGPAQWLDQLHHDMQSLRNQVKNRRQFILQQIPKDPGMR